MIPTSPRGGPATSTVFAAHYDEPAASARIADAIRAMLPAGRAAVLACIGTDRSTGDALGPLVGTRLARLGLPVYGTLDDPMTASNIPARMDAIRSEHPGAFVLAVDACLGRLDSIGRIVLATGPLLPGAAVEKHLPAVGNAHLVGTVNISGFAEFFVLQNTRLALVMHMAEVMADGIAMALAPALVEAAAGRAG